MLTVLKLSVNFKRTSQNKNKKAQNKVAVICHKDLKKKGQNFEQINKSKFNLFDWTLHIYF